MEWRFALQHRGGPRLKVAIRPMGFWHIGQQMRTGSFATVTGTHAGKASSNARMRWNLALKGRRGLAYNLNVLMERQKGSVL